MSTSIWDMILDVSPGSLADLERPRSGVSGGATRASVEQLEARLDWTLMVCEAMWSLLKEHADVSDEQLVDRITQLDLEDGKLDGKKARPPATCGECGHVVSQRLRRCMHCGAALDGDGFA